MYGDDFEYASSRLAGTIVRHGEEPFIVEDVGIGMAVTGAYLTDLTDIIVVPFKELNLKPVPLGACNTAFGGTYLSRLPMRRDWKQGLRKTNFITSNGLAAAQIGPLELRATILGDYPSYKDIVSGLVAAYAWHRDWFVSGNKLHYKSFGPVGRIKDGTPILSNEYTYLQESLQESL